MFKTLFRDDIKEGIRMSDFAIWSFFFGGFCFVLGAFFGLLISYRRERKAQEGKFMPLNKVRRRLL